MQFVKPLISMVLVSMLGFASGSEKKGLVSAAKLFHCDDFEVLNNFTWWYDWRLNFWYYNKIQQPPCDMNPYKSKFVSTVSEAELKKPTTWFPSMVKFVLGFNEPNFKSQSNLTASEAAAYWPTLVARAGTTRKIVSPSASPCGKASTDCSDAFQWFDEFFSIINKTESNRVDYLATHAYYCKADDTMKYLKDLYDRYGLNIWLTEFACPKTNNPAEQLEYMKAILPRLENAAFIEKYSWFMNRVETDKYVKTSASLLKADNTTQLTTLGEYYNNFQ